MAEGRIRPRADLAQVAGPGRVALVDLRNPGEAPVILQGSAAVVWTMLDGARDLDAVVAAVAAEYGVAPAEVEAGVRSFVDDLIARGLVATADG